MHVHETIAHGSLSYRPSRAAELCVKRDWLYTMPSPIAQGYSVRVQSFNADVGAGSLSIGPVDGGPDSRVHTFYGDYGDFRDMWRYHNSSGSGSSANTNYNLTVLSRALNISLRANGYLNFSLSFRPLSGARVAS